MVTDVEHNAAHGPLGFDNDSLDKSASPVDPYVISKDASPSGSKPGDGAPGFGRRIAPPRTSPDSDAQATLEQQLKQEAGNDIKYRSCSWRKTAALLFSEYIALAIMSFPLSYSVLGLFPGILLTVVVAAIVLYTSYVLWEFCRRHPEVRDVCDIGQMLFWDSRWAWWLTAIMFLLNNTFIQALHCLVGAQYLNTVSSHGACTTVFAVVVAVLSFICSLPRTFSGLSTLAIGSAFFTFISVVLATVFSAVEPHPAGYDPDPVEGGEPNVLAIPQAGTTFVAGMAAFLNISYTLIGQITLPSFIAEMENPDEFPKALKVVTAAEVVVFTIVGGVIYGYTGTQYMSSPAFGSLDNVIFKNVSFSFMIPTLIFVGVLYASVSARLIFFRLFDGSRHKSEHTVIGWSVWAGILAALWALAFIISEVIPFFQDLLSIMSSLFDSFFGFIFWGMAYLRMRHVDHGRRFYRERGVRGWVGFLINVGLIVTGLFFLGPGTYVSVENIIQDYQGAAVRKPFSCEDNGL